MGYKHFGVNTGGLPIDYIKWFIKEHDIPIFIETGTAGGDSVREASKIFSKCHTIEIVEGRPQGEFPANVQLHEGDSSKQLREIASWYPKEKIFFWLDAHWSEPHEAPEGTIECPILQEIQAIETVKERALIMIDDARLFYGAPPWPCNPVAWPRFMHVFDKLRQCFPNHIITIVDDYILAFPDSMRYEHFGEWRARFLERYPIDETRLKQSVKDAYNALLKYME
jgi:hypothetical protein